MNDQAKGSVSPPPLSWNAVPSKTPGLVTRTIVDETVVVPVKGRLAQLQNLYILTPVGNHIWSAIDGVNDLEAIHRLILDAYDVGDDEARTDLLEFIHSMRDAGLLQCSVSGDEAPAR